MKPKKSLIIILAVIILLFTTGWATKYFLLDASYIPEESNFELDLDEVRALAVTDKNSLPLRLNSLVVAEAEIPDWVVIAGGAPDNFPINFTSFQVVYNDKTVIIETPFNQALYDKFTSREFVGIRGKGFYEDNYQLMQQAMREADAIIATHEHWDHIGGVAQSPSLMEILPKTILTTEQVHGPTIKDAKFPVGTFDDYTPLEYERYHLLTPGIVLIKAPGHSVGSQMVYVQLQDGTDFLFIGDTGWNMVNIEKEVNHSQIAMLLRYENGEQLGHQIKWLYKNVYQNPNENINLITSHDPEQLKQLIRAKLIGQKFEIYGER